MINILPESPLISGSKNISIRKLEPPKIDQGVQFTPWEVEEALEYSPSHYANLLNPRSKSIRSQTHKAPPLPNLIPNIETYTRGIPKSPQNVLTKEKKESKPSIGDFYEKDSTFSLKKQIENKVINQSKAKSFSFKPYPKEKSPNETNVTAYQEENNMGQDPAFKGQEEPAQKARTPVNIKVQSPDLNLNEVKKSPFQRKSRENNANYIQTRDCQFTSAKFSRCIKGFFDKEDGSMTKDRSFKNNEHMMQKNIRAKSIGPDVKSTQETLESSKEGGNSFTLKHDLSMKEDSETRTINKSFTLFRSDLMSDPDAYAFKGRKIRMPRKHKTGLKSFDEKSASRRAEESEEMNSTETPNSINMKHKKIPLNLPISTAVFLSKGYRGSLKAQRIKQTQQGQVLKPLIGGQDDKKEGILNLDFKGNDFLNPIEKPLTEISNLVIKLPIRNPKRFAEVPSMIECLRKNQKKGSPTHSYQDSYNFPNINNYYDPSQTPLLRTLKKTLDGRKRNDVAEYSLTEPDDKSFKYNLNKSYKPRINVPSRKPSHASTLKDKFEGILNHITESSLTGVKISKMKILEEKTNTQERHFDRLLSCPARRAAKPSIGLQVHQSRT